MLSLNYLCNLHPCLGRLMSKGSSSCCTIQSLLHANDRLVYRAAATRHLSCAGNTFFRVQSQRQVLIVGIYQPSQRVRGENDPRETNHPVVWTDLLWWCQGSKVRVGKLIEMPQNSVTSGYRSVCSRASLKAQHLRCPFYGKSESSQCCCLYLYSVYKHFFCHFFL